ncbi:MAG: alpha/beta hydrolase fold domain-containing protein [Pseudomonadota bacterium]
MPRTVTTGPLGHRIASWAVMIGCSFAALSARAAGRPINPAFWRRQFTRALNARDMGEGRVIFDSLQTYTDEVCAVRRQPMKTPEVAGDWIEPQALKTDVTLLYLHGGGYALYGAVARTFAETLAHHLGARLFALDYRLTPEHPHPAQRDDALAAVRHLLGEGVSPERLVLIGDSAGGHLTLMTLIAIREAGRPQPALAVGLCPWTDIGDRGESLHGNDAYDLVQGWMALRFGEWLQGDTGATREALSPIHQDYRGLAPVYLQAGGREILLDMIRDFARELGCDATLDVWPEMTHVFQAHSRTRPESAAALDRIAAAIAHRTGDGGDFGPIRETEVAP